MNNQYYYENWYRQEKEQILNPEEGLIKGNLFQNLYSEYKNYQPQMINPKTEEEKMLWKIQSLSFATHELNLYLDLHPEEQSMIILFNDYNKELNNIIQEYEKKYGPLTVNNSMDNYSFTWINPTWPWEGYHV